MEALSFIGALSFGLVVGWVTSSTLRRAKRDSLTDTGAFAPYCIGLAIGFFVYIPLAMSKNAPDWLGEAPGTSVVGDGGAGGGLPPIRRN
jgi:hypothetical protein